MFPFALGLYLTQSPTVAGLVVWSVMATDSLIPAMATSPALVGRLPVDLGMANKLQTGLQVTLDNQLIKAGATVAIINSDGRVWLGAAGLSDLAMKTRMQPQDRLQVASITKTFVATVVLQLVQEGKLRLDDPINRWLPTPLVNDLPYGHQITIRQLLNHTSGIHDYTDPDTVFGKNLVPNSRKSWQPQNLLTPIKGLNPYFAPGTVGKWRYSNSNYILLGLVVEAITSSTLETEIRRRVLEPLKLGDTFFGNAEVIPGRLARGYWDIEQQGGPTDLSDVNLSAYWASGAMVSTAADLVRFTEALFGGELLKPDLLAQMTTFVDTHEGGGYGLGVSAIDTPWGKAWGHAGSLFGYEALMLYLPDRRVTAVVLLNQRELLSSPTIDILDASLRIVLDPHLSLEP
ncbi:serine hydrolase [Leptolyngbya sp. FACHB-261]|uniref:serine hydrolase domain-containing protein n=1 Tax=Leptolyngbya sp. FACHB-261 TaxID=2692806 RepID=UPI0016867035|nr:serine hydrolase domain-containing protein [Leptolyngbya sp. FACHB-261]MBD2099394.1 beta-lactamase family protein [Leptolyngbya sp. FACHB-261]